jgi:ATP-dependent Lon protease
MARGQSTTGPGNHRELRPEELRWTCDLSKFDLAVSEREARLIGIIGQDRAIRAMKMGITLYSPGYNIFVCGITGTGRTTTVKRILDNIKSSCPLPLDRCYVHNFAEPERPRLIVLHRGSACTFRRHMQRFAREASVVIPHTLESDRYVKKREKIGSKYESQGDRLIDRFDRRVEKEGFTLKRIRVGDVTRPELFPEVGGQAVHMTDLDQLVKAKKISATQVAKITKRYSALRVELEGVARESRRIMERLEAEVAALEKADVTSALEEAARTVSEKYTNPAIDRHLKAGIAHLAENIDLFRPTSLGAEGDAAGEAAGQAELREKLLALYDVNVVLDNAPREKCPVVIENLPTYRRLFGYFDKDMDSSGHWRSDYGKIRAGSLLKGDGGYLVLNAEEVLRFSGVWQALKRTLVNSALEIYEEGSPLQVPATSMSPEPIPINLKVILIGDSRTYHMLYNRDADFRKIFKVLADFDHEIDLNRKHLRQYAAFVAKMCCDEGLGPFEPGAVAAVAEYGARRAGRQKKLTARFGDISDLLREADYCRRREGRGKVSAKHVKAARKAADQRNGMWEEKIREMIARGQILLEVKGRKAGQINGLVIHDSGAHAFGVPARITATAAPGSAGIINIEREAKLSGSSHDKGVLIIGGCFREKFGRKRPVTFTASVAFEQSYAGVDGDSASATEVFAIVSALTDLPLDQGIAVTGSVDQKGMIQPVGGINLKIEGFFEVCRAKGLTGKQGVILPEANLADLMLRQEVVDAVKKKRFHLYPIRTIEDGLEILTGLPAGKLGKDGDYTEGSIFARVSRRLAEIAKHVRRTPSPPPAASPQS